MSKVAVIGANSMVGSRFCELSGLDLIKSDLHSEIKVDITDIISVKNFFKNHKFSTLILFSAFTDVDAAEKQKGNKIGSCYTINVIGAQNIALLCQEHNVKLIFISTDFVFDGKNGPYDENEKIDPDNPNISWYGLTKAKAEKIIEKILQEFIILRISYPYRANFSPKVDFARNILKRAKEKNLYPMFSDQTFTPTFIDDLKKTIETLLENKNLGIYHLASPTITTPFNFAKELLNTFNIEMSQLQKGSLKEYLKISKTPRPLNGGLKVDKLQALQITPTSWQEGIKKLYVQSVES